MKVTKRYIIGQGINSQDIEVSAEVTWDDLERANSFVARPADATGTEPVDKLHPLARLAADTINAIKRGGE
jgi:hypothetical protein